MTSCITCSACKRGRCSIKYFAESSMSEGNASFFLKSRKTVMSVVKMSLLSTKTGYWQRNVSSHLFNIYSSQLRFPSAFPTCLFQKILAGHCLLTTFQSRRDSLRGVGRVEIWSSVEEALHGAISIERRHVEQHLSRLEGKEERAGVGQLTDPRR